MKNFLAFMFGVSIFVAASYAYAAEPIFQYRASSALPWENSEAAACVARDVQSKAQLETNGWTQVNVVTVQCSWNLGVKHYATGVIPSGPIRSPPSGNSSASLSRRTGCADGGTPDTSKPLAQQCADPQQCPPVGTVSGHGQEAYISGLSINLCTAGCGLTAQGAIKAGDKYIAFGPFTSTGACTEVTPMPEVPAERCSYRGPSGKCEAACSPGQTYRMVPTGAMACVKTAPEAAPEPPKDTSCPRGYLNSSNDPAAPNCVPTGGLGNTNPDGPATCPAGQHSQSTNGGSGYCVFDKNDQQPKDTETSKTPETITVNPDGSTSKSVTTTTTNRDGSKTNSTTTTTTKSDGTSSTKTTEETTKASNGTEGKSDGKPEDKFDLCKTNPGLNICKNSTVKNVNQGCVIPTCEGDAITCAILQQEAGNICKQKRDEDAMKASASYALGNAAMNGNDPMAESMPTKENGETFNMTALNQNSFLGGGSSCMADKQISVLGQSVTLPFSSVCPYLLPFRYMMMIIAALVSLKILARPVFGD